MSDSWLPLVFLTRMFFIHSNMQIKVKTDAPGSFCEDRIGLTRELLDLLAARNIDLRGIEIDTIGRIYLNFNELDFEVFRQLMAEIRHQRCYRRAHGALHAIRA